MLQNNGSIKILKHFWRTLKMPSIDCKINLILTWSVSYFIVYTDHANWGSTFAITETKVYVLVVTSSTQDNAKLLQQLKSGFKRIINWNKYLPKPELLKPIYPLKNWFI